MANANGQGRRVVIVVDMLRGFLESGYPLDCGDTARAFPRSCPISLHRLAS